MARKKDWGDTFLATLEDTHLVSEAAKRAGVHRTTAWRRRQTDEVFAERWDDVEERSTEILEQIAVKRAAEGSDLLLIFMLKARRPDVYREHKTLRHEGPDGGPVGLDVYLDATVRNTLSDALRSRRVNH